MAAVLALVCGGGLSDQFTTASGRDACVILITRMHVDSRGATRRRRRHSLVRTDDAEFRERSTLAVGGDDVDGDTDQIQIQADCCQQPREERAKGSDAVTTRLNIKSSVDPTAPARRAHCVIKTGS